MFKITTLMPVNARKGPGMEFDIVSKIDPYESLESTETSKDPKDITWFKTTHGWVCGKYVTLAKDAQKRNLNPKKRTVADEASGEGSDGPTEVSPKSTAAQSVNQSVRAATDSNNFIGNVAGGLSSVLGGLGLNFVGGDQIVPDEFLARRFFGVPYQWLADTDLRSGGADGDLGHFYFDMLKESPRLVVVPGKPMFLADMDNETKKSYIQAMADSLADLGTRITNNITSDAWRDKLGSGEYDMKFFSFQQDWTDFRRYFNSMVQQTAIFMGIGGESVPGAEGEHTCFGEFDWSNYTLSMYMAGRKSNAGYGNFGSGGDGSGGAGAEDQSFSEKISSWTSSMYDKFNQAMSGDQSAADMLQSLTDDRKYYTEFYINPNIGYTETFNNITSQSIFAQLFENASEMAKEFGFFMDSVRYDEAGRASTNQKAEEIMRSQVNSLGLSGGGIQGLLNRFLHGATTVLSGANLVFPDIWKNASFGKSYNIEIELKTAYGNRKNILMDLFVPAWFWICLTAPRQLSVNSFRSPFLLRCHVPGIFNSDMAIVESLNISKGGDGTAWSAEGFPLEMRLSINIRELYSSLSISSINAASLDDAYNYLWNTALHDYIGSMSGLDMREADTYRKLQVAKTLAGNAVRGFFEHPFDTLAERIAAKSRDILRK